MSEVRLFEKIGITNKSWFPVQQTHWRLSTKDVSIYGLSLYAPTAYIQTERLAATVLLRRGSLLLRRGSVLLRRGCRSVATQLQLWRLDVFFRCPLSQGQT